MEELDEKPGLLTASPIEMIHVHEEYKLLMFRRGSLVFAFNFHPTQSQPDYRFGVPEPKHYHAILDTDDFWFGGHGLVDPGQAHPSQSVPADHRDQSIQIYIPARTAQVLLPSG